MERALFVALALLMAAVGAQRQAGAPVQERVARGLSAPPGAPAHIAALKAPNNALNSTLSNTVRVHFGREERAPEVLGVPKYQGGSQHTQVPSSAACTRVGAFPRLCFPTHACSAEVEINWVRVRQWNCTETCLTVDQVPLRTLAAVTSGVRTVCSFVKHGRRFIGGFARPWVLRGGVGRRKRAPTPARHIVAGLGRLL